jgi:hypothetical protein
MEKLRTCKDCYFYQEVIGVVHNSEGNTARPIGFCRFNKANGEKLRAISGCSFGKTPEKVDKVLNRYDLKIMGDFGCDNSIIKDALKRAEDEDRLKPPVSDDEG